MAKTFNRKVSRPTKTQYIGTIPIGEAPPSGTPNWRSIVRQRLIGRGKTIPDGLVDMRYANATLNGRLPVLARVLLTEEEIEQREQRYEAERAQARIEGAKRAETERLARLALGAEIVASGDYCTTATARLTQWQAQFVPHGIHKGKRVYRRDDVNQFWRIQKAESRTAWKRTGRIVKPNAEPIAYRSNGYFDYPVFERDQTDEAPSR